MEKRRMCPHCRAFITTDDRVCPYCQTEVGPRAVDRRRVSDAMGGLIPQARFTTVVIMLINIGLYIVTVLVTSKSGGSGFTPDGQTLALFGAKLPPGVFGGGQWWRFVTAGFLHGGILHILMNMWVLFDLGAQVEEVCGTARFLGIYLVSNITGFFVSYHFLPYLSIGASAAIFGLIGGMIGVGVRDRTSFGTAIRRFFTRWAIYGLILSLIPGTDIAAHIGGLAGGFVVGFIAETPGHWAPVERAWRIAAGVMLAITVLAFVEMVQFMVRVQG